jgi:hypothetical protein
VRLGDLERADLTVGDRRGELGGAARDELVHRAVPVARGCARTRSAPRLASPRRPARTGSSYGGTPGERPVVTGGRAPADAPRAR